LSECRLKNVSKEEIDWASNTFALQNGDTTQKSMPRNPLSQRSFLRRNSARSSFWRKWPRADKNPTNEYLSV